VWGAAYPSRTPTPIHQAVGLTGTGVEGAGFVDLNSISSSLEPSCDTVVVAVAAVVAGLSPVAG